jgi:hypothetical protein
MGGHSVNRGFVLAAVAVFALMTCRWAVADGGAVKLADGSTAVTPTEQGEPKLPNGWRELPELVSDIQPPLGFEAVHKGWGDPSNGTFLVSIQLSGPAADDTGLHTALRGGIAKAGNTEISQQESSDDGQLRRSQFRFRRGTLTGLVRTRSEAVEGTIYAQSAACFYNQRYPRLSEKQCIEILDSLIGSAPQVPAQSEMDASGEGDTP